MKMDTILKHMQKVFYHGLRFFLRGRGGFRLPSRAGRKTASETSGFLSRLPTGAGVFFVCVFCFLSSRHAVGGTPPGSVTLRPPSGL